MSGIARVNIAGSVHGASLESTSPKESIVIQRLKNELEQANQAVAKLKALEGLVTELKDAMDSSEVKNITEIINRILNSTNN